MIRYESNGNVAVKALRTLYQTVGWANYLVDETTLAGLLAGPRHYIASW